MTASLLPAPVRNPVDWSGITIGATSVTVASGADLNAAIAAAIAAGKRQILLDPGAVFTQAITLPDHGFADWMVLKTNVASPPSAGTRMMFSNSSGYNLAKIVAPMNSYAIQHAAGSKRWRVELMQISRAATTGGADGDTHCLINTGPDSITQWTDVPDQIDYNQCLIYGDPTNKGLKNTRAGIVFSGTRVHIRNSTIAYINYGGNIYSIQSQSAGSFAGTGKVKIENCTLWRTTECVAHGGASQYGALQTYQVMVTDFLVDRCHIYGSPAQDGIQGGANGTEAKKIRRWTVMRSIIENVNAGLQNGHGAMLWTVNQPPGDPGENCISTTDILFDRVWFKNTSGISAWTSKYDTTTSGLTKRIRFVDCFATGLGVSPKTAWRIFDLDPLVDDVSVERCCFLMDGSYPIVTNTNAGTRFNLKNSIFGQRPGSFACPVWYTSGGTGDTAWTTYFNTNGSNEFSGNLVVDLVGGTTPNPSGNTIVTDLSSAGFVNSSYLFNPSTKYADLGNLVNTSGKGPDFSGVISPDLSGVEIPDAERTIFET